MAAIMMVRTRDAARFYPGLSIPTDIFGTVLDGDWDVMTIPIEESVFYKTVVHLMDGGDYADSPQARCAARQFAQGAAHVRGKPTLTDYIRIRGPRLLALIEDIRKNGVQTIQQVRERPDCPVPPYVDPMPDDIAIAFDRHGRPGIANGNHRMAIAYAIGIEWVPAIIGCRHPQWAETRERIMYHAAREWGPGRCYSPIEHPDFDLAPQWSGSNVDQIIRDLDFAGIHEATCLDAGTLYGTTAIRLGRVGHTVVGLDHAPDHVMAATAIVGAVEGNVRIVQGELFDHDPGPYRVICLLNILHHALKREATFKRMLEWLGRIRAEKVYLQGAGTQEGQMRGAYMPMGQEAFAGFVADCIPGIGTWKMIGEQNGRRLFALH